MRTFVAVAAAAATAALLAAGSAQASTSKADFIARGDRLCTQAIRELEPIRRRAEAAKKLPEYRQWAAAASIWSDQIALQVRFNRKLRAIGAPPGDATARSLLAQLDQGVVLARRVRDAFADARIAQLATAVPAYVKFTLRLNKRIKAYGFRVCGS
jgi:hypothetical protein